MPSSKYHREQAKVLAGLALSTNDRAEAARFTRAAMEHLERAQASGDADNGPFFTSETSTDKYADRP
jgi:hypothetical protein